MKECIFCKIINKEIPSHTVYEDDKYLSFLTIEPESPGHTLVIPKKHFKWVWDMPDVGEYFEIVKKIASAQKKAYDTDFVLSKIIGEDVPHAHIHVYPSRNVKGDKEDFATQKQMITQNL